MPAGYVCDRRHAAAGWTHPFLREYANGSQTQAGRTLLSFEHRPIVTLAWALPFQRRVWELGRQLPQQREPVWVRRGRGMLASPRQSEGVDGVDDLSA